jgi:predicted secreted protein
VSVVSLVHGVVLFGSFAILWFLSLFCLLPVGLGADRDPDSGAPLSPMLGRKALLATAIAAVLWVVFYLLIAFKILDL